MAKLLCRLRRILAMLAIAGVLAVGALLGGLWIERGRALTLPAPTGPFAVGRTIQHWAGQDRELMVWIWYPAESGRPPDDYLPAPLRPPPGPWMFRLLTRDPSKVHGHSARDANVSARQSTYPVLIMRAGASAPVINYSTLAEDLASHGYVVVGFDAPYRTIDVVFPDGRVISRKPENNPELYSGAELERVAVRLLAAWTADTAFVLDRLQTLTGRFAGKLDMTRVGVFGHSFGGATAAEFCSKDDRCKAGIDIDGSLHGSVVQTGIHKPFMFLLSGLGDFSSDAEVRQIKADIQSVYDRLPPDRRFVAVIRGANHFMFSDDPALLKSGLVRKVLRIFGVLGIDGRRQLAITDYCVRTFFDGCLTHGSRPDLSSPSYPELEVSP
jgi:predicted dienelactone hydrolase